MLWEPWYFIMFTPSSRVTAIPPHSPVIYRIRCHWGCNGPFNLHILSTVQTQQTWVGTDVEKVEENILTCDKQWLDNVWTFSAAFQFWRRLGFAGLLVCFSLFLFRTSGSDSTKNSSSLYTTLGCINQLTFCWVPYFKLLFDFLKNICYLCILEFSCAFYSSNVKFRRTQILPFQILCLVHLVLSQGTNLCFEQVFFLQESDESEFPTLI